MDSKVMRSKFVRAQSDRVKEIEGWARQGRKNIEQSGQLPMPPPPDPQPHTHTAMDSKVMKSKFVRARSDRIKEIEGWARQGRKNIEFIKQSGQLSENITEDLMLHEKLMDLSKSRYKFKSNNKFEQKMFLQRQMRKSGAMRDALADINLDKIVPKWASEPNAPRHTSISSAPAHRHTTSSAPEPNALRHTGSPAPEYTKENTPPQTQQQIEEPIIPSSYNKTAREKPESAPARRRQILPDDGPPRPQTRASYSIESRLSSASTEHNFFQTQPKIEKRRIDASNATKSAVTFNEPPKSTQHQRALPRRSSLRRGSLYKQPIASWAKKSAVKYQSDDSKAPLRDVRYTELAQSLSSVYNGYKGHQGPEVEVIVNMLEALHVPTSRPLESRRPKVTARIKDFLLQTGVTVN